MIVAFWTYFLCYTCFNLIDSQRFSLEMSDHIPGMIHTSAPASVAR